MVRLGICKKLWRSVYRFLGCFLVGLWLAIALPIPSQGLEFAPPSASVEAQLIEGLNNYHQGDVLAAIAIWQDVLRRLPEEHSPPRLHQERSDEGEEVSYYPRVLRYLARGYRDAGNDVEQIAILDQLITYYRSTRDERHWGRIQTEKAAAYQRQGKYRQSEAMLCQGPGLVLRDRISFDPLDGERLAFDYAAQSLPIGSPDVSMENGVVVERLDAIAAQCSEDSAIRLAQNASDVEGEIAAWGRLGTGYWNQGQYDLAVVILSKALERSQNLAHQPYQTALLNSLGGTYASLGQRHYRYTQLAQRANDVGQEQQQRQQAQFYDDSAIALLEAGFAKSRADDDSIGALHSLLNILPLYQRSFPTQMPDKGRGALREATTILSQLPPSHERLQLGLKLALLWQSTDADFDSSASQTLECSTVPPAETVELLQQLQAMAYGLDDQQMVAEILGHRGLLAACADDPAALELLYQAQLAARTPEQHYQWAWRAGQLLAQKGEVEEAIALYEQAVQSLNSIRTNLAGANRDLQLNVRDRAEGLYRQLAELRLQQLEGWQRQSQNADRTTETFQAQSSPHSLGPSSIKQQDITRQDMDSADLTQVDFKQVDFKQGGRHRSDLTLQDLEHQEQKTLSAVLETLDGLRLTELQNYLGDDCELPLIEPKPGFTSESASSSTANSADRSMIPAHTAVISTIIFPDRLAVILTTVSEAETPRYSLHWVPMEQEAFTDVVNDFRFNLEKRSDLTQRFRPQAEQFYDWLIRPFEAELAQLNIDSLVFIHDGILRSVPMAVLHDGTQFLAETYNIFNTPSLKIASSTPLQLSRSNAVLAFGLTQSSTIGPWENSFLLPSSASSSQAQSTVANTNRLGQGTVLTPLPAVQRELDAIQQLLPDSQIFFNQDFTRDRLRQELTSDSPQILHLATHARFGFEAQQTYLVTGQQVRSSQGSDASPSPAAGDPRRTYNDTINLNELYRLIKQTQEERENVRGGGLDFLVLTACETAVGSDRDALGLAGIAVQAGVKSSLASLWQVDDQVTADLIRQFYQNLAEGHTKSASLRLAQQKWLQDHPRGRYSHPGYWAPFVLVGTE